MLPAILPHVTIYTWSEESSIKGFAGVAENKMEMLFIDPNSMAPKDHFHYCNYN